MNCAEYLTLLSGHLDQMNTSEQEAALQKHLDTCPDCSVLLIKMQENDKKLAASIVQPPADLTQRIMRQLPKREKKHRAWKPALISGLASGLCVAALMAFVVRGNILPMIQPSSAESTSSMSVIQDKAELADTEAKAGSVESHAFSSPAVEFPPVDCDTDALLYGTPLEVVKETADTTAPTKRHSSYDVYEEPLPMLMLWGAYPEDFELMAGFEPADFDSIPHPLPLIGQIAAQTDDFEILAYVVDFQIMEELLLQCRGQYQLSTFYPLGDAYSGCVILFLNSK